LSASWTELIASLGQCRTSVGHGHDLLHHRALRVRDLGSVDVALTDPGEEELRAQIFLVDTTAINPTHIVPFLRPRGGAGGWWDLERENLQLDVEVIDPLTVNPTPIVLSPESRCFGPWGERSWSHIFPRMTSSALAPPPIVLPPESRSSPAGLPIVLERMERSVPAGSTQPERVCAAPVSEFCSLATNLGLSINPCRIASALERNI
jgi:hypothetical protein